MTEVFVIAGLILLSSVKYVFVVLALLAQSPRLWFYDFLIVFSGGSIGVIVFTFLGSLISKYLERFAIFKIRYRNRKRFVTIKRSYGLIGIAFLTPLILGVPLGTILACLFEPDKKIVLRVELVSVFFWSILLFGIKGFIQFLN